MKRSASIETKRIAMRFDKKRNASSYMATSPDVLKNPSCFAARLPNWRTKVRHPFGDGLAQNDLLETAEQQRDPP